MKAHLPQEVLQLSVVTGACQYLLWPSGHRGVQGEQCRALESCSLGTDSSHKISGQFVWHFAIAVVCLLPPHLCFAGYSGC